MTLIAPPDPGGNQMLATSDDSIELGHVGRADGVAPTAASCVPFIDGADILRDDFAPVDQLNRETVKDDALDDVAGRADRRATIHGGGTMAEPELTTRGKVGMGAACAVCCGVPMLVIVGAVSLSAVAAVGIVGGAVALVAVATWAFWRRRLPPTTLPGRLAMGAVGAGAAGVGIGIAGSAQDVSRWLVLAGVAVLACTALLALDDVRARTGVRHPSPV